MLLSVPMTQTSNPTRKVPTRRISFEESLRDLPKHFADDGRIDAAAAQRFWYPMWDAGLKVGHSVRSVRDSLSLADTEVLLGNLKICVSLIHRKD